MTTGLPCLVMTPVSLVFLHIRQRLAAVVAGDARPNFVGQPPCHVFRAVTVQSPRQLTPGVLPGLLELCYLGELPLAICAQVTSTARVAAQQRFCRQNIHHQLRITGIDDGRVKAVRHQQEEKRLVQ